MKHIPFAMATQCDTPRAVEISSTNRTSSTLDSSTDSTHNTSCQEVKSFSKSPEEHRGESQEITPSTGADQISATQTKPLIDNPTPQEKSTKGCPCATRQHLQTPVDKRKLASESSSHYLAHVLPSIPHLKPITYELNTGFRQHHYYYSPHDHLQHPSTGAPFATVANSNGFYQNCCPYSIPLNLELCYFQYPQICTQHLQYSHPPEQPLLFLPNNYSQHQIGYRYSTPNLNYTPHSFRNFQNPYHPSEITPFYTPLFTAPHHLAIPPIHHQLPIRSHATNALPPTYPISSLNYTQPIEQQSSTSSEINDTSSIEKLVSYLPVEAQPTEIRQAYGMDKVWSDEFEHLFSQLSTEVIWTLIEVESNPTIIDSDSIIAYNGHYIIMKPQYFDDDTKDPGFCEDDEEHNLSPPDTEDQAFQTEIDGTVDKTECSYTESNNYSSDDKDKLLLETESKEKEDEDKESSTISSELVDSKDSDCDSGAQTHCPPAISETLTSNYQSGTLNNEQSISPARSANLPTRFRMFIDSAKVRFSCNQCGHGWTSMKGYCAYKLFGQQCDICKVENRFERPMWYPEEVSKVLNNMYNKVGQVYFGFQMPTIDKQRRAGKPKTSHNSSLCQACQNGLCTDRK